MSQADAVGTDTSVAGGRVVEPGTAQNGGPDDTASSRSRAPTAWA